VSDWTMCETGYFLRSIFAPFEPQIRDVFARAMSDARLNPSDNQLVLADRSHRLDQYEAEFAAIVRPGRVQITWNGIASLWACAQGLARLTRRMFDAQRARVERLSLSEDVELERGLYFYALARRLAKNRFDRWVDWVPPPVATATQGDDRLGNRLFLAALGWIIRHELAHLALQHHTRINAVCLTRYDAEVEADEQASTWLKSSFEADHLRPAGASTYFPVVCLRNLSSTFLAPSGEMRTRPSRESNSSRRALCSGRRTERRNMLALEY
jgi:Peptidase U49